MSSLKVLAVAGAVVVGAAMSAVAGDLPAPPPAPHFDAPLRGTVAAGGFYLRGDVGVGINKHKPGIELRQGGQVFAPTGYDVGFPGVSLDSSASFGVGVGYQFNNWLRMDVTGEYRTAARFSGRDTITPTNPANPATPNFFSNVYSGSIATTLLMANGYVDLGTFCGFGCITPFVGAGIGLANHKFSPVQDAGLQRVGSATGAFIQNTSDYFEGKSRTNLAWAVMAGAAVDVSSNVKLELSYRYLNMGRAETGTLGGGNPPATVLRVKDIDSHDFRLGMRWALNGGDCCAPAAHAAPVFAPAPMIRKF
ncbi:MAG: outer membrane protein [Bosea sp. (in: a-proteobacteria)]